MVLLDLESNETPMSFDKEDVLCLDIVHKERDVE